MRRFPNFEERKLYHQIHPLKLGTDIGAALAFLFLLWHHRVTLALVAGFVPPVLISAVMMVWPVNVEKLKNSPFGKYISKYMTSTIEVVRLLTLVPMAWGAWTHHSWLIALGLIILLSAWCNGLIWPRNSRFEVEAHLGDKQQRR